MMRQLSPRTFRALGAASLLLGSAGLAAAQAQEPASFWGVGLGVGFERKAYRDFDNKVRALPLLMYENRWVAVGGPGIDLKLPSAGPLSFRLRARYTFDGYEDDDSPYLAGMAERKGGLWLGAAAQWRGELGTLSAELLGDASGHSEGRQFKLQLDRRFQSGAFDLTPRVAAISLDRKYVDYYYGVRTGEAVSGRTAYAGSSAVNMELGLRLGYSLAPGQQLFLDLSGTRLGSGIKDSPLLERSSETGLRVGYLYRF
jgi:MipA family protein